MFPQYFQFGSMANTCNFCAVEDQSVAEIRNSFTQDPPMLDIAAKHFWFTKDELISFRICGSCRKQLLEFHQFYCQVKMLHSAFREMTDIKVEYEPFESNTNHIEHDSVDLKPDTENDCEEQIDDIEVGANTSRIELEPLDIKTEEISNEERINKNCGEPKIARRGNGKRPSVTDDEIRIFCRLQCHICSEEFDYLNNLLSHCRKVHNQSGYVKCCDRRFNRFERLQEHILIHMDPTRFQCKECKRNLKSMRSLIRHKDSVHRSEDAMIYKCTMCPKKYAKLYLLNGHMACHLDPRPSESRPKCPICQQLMKNEGWLEVHMTHKHGTTV